MSPVTTSLNSPETRLPQPRIALIACGALARDLLVLREKNQWPVDLFCLPATLHNTPPRIIDALEAKIDAIQSEYDELIVIYGDCGTGGALDLMLDRRGIARIAGPHCYEQFGGAAFDQIMDAEPGTFFLTDFLVRQFDSLVWRGLGLDRYPQLRDDYFGNYRQVAFLAQENDPDRLAALIERAEIAAARLNLPLIVIPTGRNGFGGRIQAQIDGAANVSRR